MEWIRLFVSVRRPSSHLVVLFGRAECFDIDK